MNREKKAIETILNINLYEQRVDKVMKSITTNIVLVLPSQHKFIDNSEKFSYHDLILRPSIF